ncbi:helix-turn-helix domain-containing protein [Neobacillus drentensis]|uniref:helix-turn-helix domain-containing protein n=1 Tax=Neobacillus drentensis TaxID=220684 RepID=UPI0030027936
MARRSEKVVYWGAFILEWFQHLQDPDFRGSDYKIMFFLCGQLKYDDNIAYIKQKQIAESLSIDKGGVSKSIKRLCQKQFIVKCQNGFMINPHLFYVGNSDTRFKNRDEFDRLLLENGLEPRFHLNEDDRILEVYEGATQS